MKKAFPFEKLKFFQKNVFCLKTIVAALIALANLPWRKILKGSPLEDEEFLAPKITPSSGEYFSLSCGYILDNLDDFVSWLDAADKFDLYDKAIELLILGNQVDINELSMIIHNLKEKKKNSGDSPLYLLDKKLPLQLRGKKISTQIANITLQ